MRLRELEVPVESDKTTMRHSCDSVGSQQHQDLALQSTGAEGPVPDNTGGKNLYRAKENASDRGDSDHIKRSYRPNL